MLYNVHFVHKARNQLLSHCPHRLCSQEPTILNKFVIIVNACDADDDCSIRQPLQDFMSSSTSSSSGMHWGSITFSTSRRSSAASSGLPPKSSFDRAKSLLKAAKSKLQAWSAQLKAKDEGASMSTGSSRRSSCEGSSQGVGTVQTPCGPSHSCLVLDSVALQAKAKHWQQAAQAMAGMSCWWKPARFSM